MTSTAVCDKKPATKVGRLICLPLVERFTTFGKQTQLSPNATLVEDKGVGIFVYHDKGEVLPATDYLRRTHMVGCKDTKCLVEAPTVGAAINTFFREWDGARVGAEHPALAINDSSSAQIIVYAECEHMHRSGDDRLICGEPEGDGTNGTYGMCMLEGGYDPPNFCPLTKPEGKRVIKGA